MRLTVTATSQPLVTNTLEWSESQATRTWLIWDPTGTAVVFLENAVTGDATTTTGAQWDFGDGTLTLTLEPGETVNARTATGSVELHAIRVGTR